MRTPLILVAVLLLCVMLSCHGCATQTEAAAETDVTAVKVAMMQFAGTRRRPDAPDVECLCGGTGRSGDGLGPCACDPECTCKSTGIDTSGLPPAPEPPVELALDETETDVAPDPPFDPDNAQTLEAPAELPVVTCYVTRNCSACEDVKRWHTDDLPFRLVFVMDDRLEPHPWFEWSVNGRKLRWPHAGRTDQSIERDYVVKVWEHSHVPGVIQPAARTEPRPRPVPASTPMRRVQSQTTYQYQQPVHTQWIPRVWSGRACRSCR